MIRGFFLSAVEAAIPDQYGGKLGNTPRVLPAFPRKNGSFFCLHSFSGEEGLPVCHVRDVRQ
jgi:hypothetical protein